MGNFLELSVRRAVSDLAGEQKLESGGLACALTALLAVSLLKKSLANVLEKRTTLFSEADVRKFEWEIDDSLLHLNKLVDKSFETSAVFERALLDLPAEGLTLEESAKAAVSAPSAVAAACHRAARIAYSIMKAVSRESAADFGIALHLLYASFMGCRAKMNEYFKREDLFDRDFVAKTRAVVADVEDEISQFVGPGLEIMWDFLDPAKAAGLQDPA